MKEQSHKEEMSRALRGDFERLRERGVAATLAPRDEAETEPKAPAPLQDDGSPPVEPDEPDEPDAVPTESPEDIGAPQAGWLARLLGRQ